jgi:O-acetylserine/cysteine efflux transporter
MRPLDILLLSLVQLIWGANYAVQKDAIATFPPLLLVGMAYAIIALILTPFTRRTHSPQWKLALLSLATCTLPTGLTFFGLAHCPVSLGTLLMQMQVPFGIAVAWMLGRGKPDARNIAGIVVALAGAALVIGMPNVEGEIWGWTFVVVGSCLWAACQAMLPVVTRDQGLRLYAGLSRHAAPQVLVASLLFETGHLDAIRIASPLAWAEMLFGATVASVLCYAIWYKLLMRVPADKILPFLLLMPAASVLAAWLMLGETLSMALLVGGTIIIAGLAIILWPRRTEMPALPVAPTPAPVPPEI